MKRYLLRSLVLALCTACWFSSCEKAVFDEDQSEKQETSRTVHVVLSVSGFQVIPFDRTRAESNLSDYCKRMNFVVYQDGKKLKTVNQLSTDDHFGKVELTLETGDYQVLILAHSANGNPTVSTPEKIQFTNADGYTDTFYSYSDLKVTETALTKEFVLERATAMFRLITSDKVPSNVDRIRFYYTGGSGALNATTGFGCVNSQQITYFDITDEQKGTSLTLEAYTIPKAPTGTLKLTVSTYSKDETLLHEKEIKDIPIEQNKITEYTGPLFTTDDTGGKDQPDSSCQQSFSIRLNTDWNDNILKGSF